jgi:hypothetical protein
MNGYSNSPSNETLAQTEGLNSHIVASSFYHMQCGSTTVHVSPFEQQQTLNCKGSVFSPAKLRIASQRSIAGAVHQSKFS